jgi:uridylate kinase
MAQTSKYKRVVLKLSGEALAGEKGFKYYRHQR